MFDGVGESHRFPPIDGLHDRCCNISNERCRRAPLEFIKSPFPRCLSAKPASSFSLWVVILMFSNFDLQRYYTPWARSSTYTDQGTCQVSFLYCILPLSLRLRYMPYCQLPTCEWGSAHDTFYMSWPACLYWYVLGYILLVLSKVNLNADLYRGILEYTNFIYISSFGKSQNISSAPKPSPNMFFSFVIGK